MNHKKINSIEVTNVTKVYNTGASSTKALKNANLTIYDNEFFTLLGPSGCGKTTLLRLIAGFEDITEGTIKLFNEEIVNLPPNKRPINTVFQHYALFPHLNVFENVAFGLRRLNKENNLIEKRTMEVLDLIQMKDYATRKSNQLSGGQQQRVALARALAPKPKVLLLDEPLSALDLKLRQAMRVELKTLQRETGITFVFVTHDQDEALSMSDRIAVMSSGQVQQIGKPSEIYEYPANRFVADFIGETNLLNATVEKIDGKSILCRLPSGQILNAISKSKVNSGQKGIISIRPEKLIMKKKSSNERDLKGNLGQSTYLGTDTQFEVILGKDLSLAIRMQNSPLTSDTYKLGDPVFVSIDDDAARFLIN